jgi:hypothetical protein
VGRSGHRAAVTRDDWPPGFCDRHDSGAAEFSAPVRLVTHVDDAAIAALGEPYDELWVPDGRVLDLVSSWVQHLSRTRDGGVVASGLNAVELHANLLAAQAVIQDLNRW